MLFEYIRKLTIPFNQIEQYVPKKGKILDVGCGHGTFSRMLAQKFPKTKILGVDPSDHKIAIAKSKSSNIPNATYKISYLKDIDSAFDCIVIMDVLYLMPNNEKNQTLKLCLKLLKKNGLLLICEIVSKPSLMFKLSYLEEIIMVKILKYTYSDKEKMFFLDTKDYLKMIRDAGFKTITYERLRAILPYQRIMYIAKK